MSVRNVSLGLLVLAAGAANASAAVLWDQVTGAVPTGGSWVSQQFEPANVNFNAAAVDDFTLSGASTIQSVDFSFAYFNGPGPVTSWRVEIYSSHAAALAAGTGLVGDVASVSGIAGGQVAAPFPQTLTLPVNIPLAAGTYWIGIIGVMPFTPGGEIGISARTNFSGAEGRLVNPGGGFAVPGNDAPFSAVTNPAGAPQDLIFRLNGVPTPGSLAILGLGGVFAARRRR